MSTGPVHVTFSADYDDYWWFAQMSEGVPVIHHPVPESLHVGEKVRRCCDACEVEWESEELECWVCGEIGRAGWISRKNMTESGVMVSRTAAWVGEVNRSCQMEPDSDLSIPPAEVW